MIINPNPILHTTVNHTKAGTPPELRRQHEAVMKNDLARQAGQTWDGGTPPPTPLPANPYSRQKWLADRPEAGSSISSSSYRTRS